VDAISGEQRYVAQLKDLGRVRLAARAEISGRTRGWVEWVNSSGETVEQMWATPPPGRASASSSTPLAKAPRLIKRWDTEQRNYTWDDHYKRRAAEASIQRDRREVQKRNAERQPVAVGIGAGGRRPSGSSIPAVTTSCQSARQHRDAHYERSGVNRTLAGSRAFDQAVWDACK